MEAGAGSGNDKLREIQDTNLRKYWETVGDGTYYNLSSRLSIQVGQTSVLNGAVRPS